jgi:molecular chaperone DnaK
LAVKLPFATAEEFLAKYGANLSRGGIYLRSKVVKPVGTVVTLDLKLTNGERIIYASAVVHFVTGQGGEGVSGMGLKFQTLDQATQRFLESAVAALPHGQMAQPPLPSGVGPAFYATPNPEAPKPTRPVITSPVATPSPTGVTVAAHVPQAPAFETPVEPPKRTGPIVGIDLGTTNSCVAYSRADKPAVLSSREGYNTVPSILALNARGKLVIGHPAKSQMLTNPRQTVYGAKRLIGRSFDSPVVQQMKDRFAYEVTPGPNGEAAVRLGDRVYSLQQISAMLLKEVRELAQNQLAHEISRAVITVPAYYSDSQRQAVREAGRLAGLHVERILNEPTAAALAYGYGRRLHQMVLVYDLGGGTFDASVLQLTDDIYEVVSTGGDTFLGGIDFDSAIVTFLLQEFQAKTGRPFEGDRVAMQRITDAAERAKCALSERTETRVHVPFVTLINNQPVDLDVMLSREKFMSLTDGLIDRTIEVCKDVLLAKGLSPKDIDEVILVGGQSRSPRVHEKITALFGKPPSKGVHPDEAVALGAALLAGSLERAEGVTLIDILPMSIGVGLPGGRFKPVLDHNTPLPAKKQYQLATSRDNQTELELTIFQGDSDRAEANEYLGTLKLNELPKGPRGSVKVDLSFEVSSEGLLKVAARETTTGRETEATLLTHDAQADVRAKMLQEAASASLPLSTVPPQPAAPADPAADAGGEQMPEAAAIAEKSSGLFGWFKRLFGPRA